MTATNDTEQQRKRQELLAAWKQKRLQKKADSGKDQDEAQKQIERQKRIDDWKKRKSGAASEKSTPEPVSNATLVKPVFSIKKAKPLLLLKKQDPITKPVRAKRSILGGEEEDVEGVKRPKFKKPTLKEAKTASKDDDDNVDLDKFILSLDTSSTSTIVHQNESEEGSDSDNEEEDILSSRLKKLQEREKVLDAVDHSKIEYNKFRKNFYKPPSEYEKLTQDEIDRIRLTLSNIRVRGSNCPVPITKWSQLGVSSNIMDVFKSLGYESPSPIQSQTLPAVMSGRDIVGVAKTGSGKTLSFVLPLIRHIQDQDPLQAGDGPIGLILTPTRELAIQIHKEVKNFSKEITATCCYGGSNIEGQIAELKKGVQVIVGTPGRVIDLLTVNGGRVSNLRRVTYLVLDEADRMYDMGFEPQVNKILGQIRPDRQTVLFSATFPKKLESLAKNGLHDPIEIIVGGINVVASEIEQKVELFEVDGIDSKEYERLKFLKLVSLLDKFTSSNEKSKILIFVEKQELADQLMVQLVSSDYNCTSLHGGKDQMDRKFAIKEFSSPTSDLNILIATSIAARGLDVKGLDLVINYDAPNHLEDYIHRVGRTGRAGATGTAVTFVTNKQERAITDLVKVMKPPIDEKLLEISQAFMAKVKKGEEKYSSGFGGHGLERLQKQRDTTKDIERQKYDEDNDTQTPAPATKQDNEQIEESLPSFDIVEGIPNDSSGPDRSRFHSRITINDLPQKARWYVTNKESIQQIIESTSASITHKGQFYPGSSKPKKDQPPKLYLLVEGLTRDSVEEANALIKEKMIEGLQAESQPSGKYTV